MAVKKEKFSERSSIMEMNTEPRVVTTPTSYIIEELGSYVDAREPELDVSVLSKE